MVSNRSGDKSWGAPAQPAEAAPQFPEGTSGLSQSQPHQQASRAFELENQFSEKAHRSSKRRVPKVSAKAKAVSLLARREHSQSELALKLKRAGYEEQEISQALQWARGHRFQSDTRFTQSLINRRSATYGDRAIASELSQHGLSWPVPAETDPPELADETDRVFNWLQRRYATKLESCFEEEAETPDREKLFQLKVKAFRALSARGFTQSKIETGWRRFVAHFTHERC